MDTSVRCRSVCNEHRGSTTKNAGKKSWYKKETNTLGMSFGRFTHPGFLLRGGGERGKTSEQPETYMRVSSHNMRLPADIKTCRSTVSLFLLDGQPPRSSPLGLKIFLHKTGPLLWAPAIDIFGAFSTTCLPDSLSLWQPIFLNGRGWER